MSDVTMLRRFVDEETRAVGELGDDEAAMIARTSELVSDLVDDDGWLPEWCAEPLEGAYSQYLLHCDPLERFSVVSFVWGPGVSTPVHDHLTWGVIGMLRGAESDTPFDVEDGTLIAGDPRHLEPGDLGVVSPTIGDIHQVSNALDDEPSISIHVYGGNIGAIRRHAFDAETSEPKDFVSGFTSDRLPNIWS